MRNERIIHFLPGDAITGAFAQAGIAGEVLVCRECLADGPKSSPGEDFWDVRARFIAESFGEGADSYRQKVTTAFDALRDAATNGAEVNLWFEYELFCQANYWFTLDFLRSAGAKLFRVAPLHRDPEKIWLGFSNHDGRELADAFSRRILISDEDIELGSGLWASYSRGDRDGLERIGRAKSEAFPFLDEVVAAAVSEDELPRRVLRQIAESGISDFAEVFARFRERLGVYGYGDDQVRRIWQQECKR